MTKKREKYLIEEIIFCKNFIYLLGDVFKENVYISQIVVFAYFDINSKKSLIFFNLKKIINDS